MADTAVSPGLIDHLQATEEFRNAILAAGLALKGDPIMDGRLHRVPIQGARGSYNRSGRYIGHLDERPAGKIWNFKTGEDVGWSASKPIRPLTEAERKERNERLQREAKEREEDRQLRQAQIASWAEDRWMALKPAGDHPYLAAKGVRAHYIRVDESNRLIVPLCDTMGNIHSLQSISENGEKHFTRGGRKRGMHHLIGERVPDTLSRPLLFAEGYSTGATLHEATGLPVAICFDSGNLLPVMQEYRKLYPNRELLIGADNDHQAKVNVGIAKAIEAARAVGNARILVPPFPVESQGTDWNDYQAEHGRDAVRDLIDQQMAIQIPQERQMTPDDERAEALREWIENDPPSERDAAEDRYYAEQESDGLDEPEPEQPARNPDLPSGKRAAPEPQQVATPAHVLRDVLSPNAAFSVGSQIVFHDQRLAGERFPAVVMDKRADHRYTVAVAALANGDTPSRADGFLTPMSAELTWASQQYIQAHQTEYGSLPKPHAPERIVSEQSLDMFAAARLAAIEAVNKLPGGADNQYALGRHFKILSHGQDLSPAQQASAWAEAATLTAEEVQREAARTPAPPRVRLTRLDVERHLAEGAKLTDKDMSGLNLSGLKFVDQNLSGSDLSNVRANYTTLQHCFALGTDFTGAQFDNCLIDDVNAAGSSWARARLHGTTFTNNVLDSAVMHDLVVSAEPRTQTLTPPPPGPKNFLQRQYQAVKDAARQTGGVATAIKNTVATAAVSAGKVINKAIDPMANWLVKDLAAQEGWTPAGAAAPVELAHNSFKHADLTGAQFIGIQVRHNNFEGAILRNAIGLADAVDITKVLERDTKRGAEMESLRQMGLRRLGCSDDRADPEMVSKMATSLDRKLNEALAKNPDQSPQQALDAAVKSVIAENRTPPPRERDNQTHSRARANTRGGR